jgi:transposase
MNNTEKVERNIQIVNLYKTGGYSCKELACQFGVSRMRINAIVNHYVPEKQKADIYAKRKILKWKLKKPV